MRISSSVTSVSWIPSEAIPGTMKIPMVLGVSHYDPPPPDVLDDLPGLHAAGGFRFANRLTAWIEVDGSGAIVDAGYTGGGLISSTVVTLGGRSRSIPPVGFPDIQREPEINDGTARFVQTVGGRTGAPMPRKVNRPPFVQITAPTVWTTLALTINADGTATHDVIGASPFPRHWFYDDAGHLVQKSGITDYRSWAGENYGQRSPWGEYDEQAIVADVETALERSLSTLIMRGGTKPRIRKVRQGATVTEQGEPGDELFLVLDGMLSVEVDGNVVAEIGPGAIAGERAVLEGGARTSTLRAMTPCRIAVASADQIDRDALVELAQGHRREDASARNGDSPV
jgi:Cyclic nucleotide-binding domain